LAAHTGTIAFPEILKRARVDAEGIQALPASVLAGWTYEKVLEINE
jgi:hypothetical protein